jgi:hypothetical protein
MRGIPWGWIAVGVVGYLILKNRGAAGGAGGVSINPKLKPAAIEPNELVTAGSYRVIQSKRPGMQYVTVEGNYPGILSFRSPPGGKFTRNTVMEGGQLLAEIAE